MEFMEWPQHMLTCSWGSWSKSSFRPRTYNHQYGTDTSAGIFTIWSIRETSLQERLTCLNGYHRYNLWCKGLPRGTSYTDISTCALTDTHYHLHNNSYHPTHCKTTILSHLRFRRICSESAGELREEGSGTKGVPVDRGHPEEHLRTETQ